MIAQMKVRVQVEKNAVIGNLSNYQGFVGRPWAGENMGL
jgi:hypothetical protein